MDRDSVHKQLNVAQRYAIITLHKENKSIGYISRKLNFSVSCINLR